MSAFHDVQFPLALSQGAQMRLIHASEVVRLSSGREVRNARWSSALREWDVSGALSSAERLTELMCFFEARRGNVHAFRFQDALDFSSGSDVPEPDDQLLDVGDGAKTVFQLSKFYDDTVRKITKPDVSSVRVLVGGNETTDFSVNGLSGEITLQTAPDVGSEVRAGFLFNVPVRFEAPSLSITLDACRAGRVPSVKFIEVREG